MAGFMDDYEPVEERLRQFWAEHPAGRIVTALVHYADGDYIFKASVFVAEHHYLGTTANGEPIYQDKQPDATGWAHDSVATLPNNMKASALEVCETSAIGRALANLGYAPKGQRPSREEMSKTVSKYQGTATKSSGEPQADGAVAPTVSADQAPANPQSPESSGDEAQTGPATHSTPPDGNGKEPGASPTVGEAAAPAPADPSTKLTRDRVKALTDALGGQKMALDLARDNFGYGIGSLRDLTEPQAAELLEIAVGNPA